MATQPSGPDAMSQMVETLMRQVQALTQDLAGQREALSRSEAAQQELRLELVRSHQELASAVARNTAQAAAVPVSGVAADADGTGVRGPYLKHIDVMRAVKQPQGLKDREQWEKLRFRLRPI